jgi:hypothetical protein
MSYKNVPDSFSAVGSLRRKSGELDSCCEELCQRRC